MLWPPPIALFAAVVFAQAALAARVGGGRVDATDCLAEFEVVGTPTERALACTDCDPSCDRDGVVTANGTCTFEIAACLGRADDDCTPAPVDRFRVRPALPLPTSEGECGPFERVTLAARGRNGRKRSIKMTAIAGRRPRRRDRSRLTLRCLPRPAGEACPLAEARDPCAQRSPIRNVYFGDLHVHTAYSFDAAVFDVGTTPMQAYRFARGEPLRLPPLDAQGVGTQVVELERPLDFAAVTDHSEFLGEVDLCFTSGSSAYDTESCRTFREGGDLAQALLGVQTLSPSPMRLADICGPDGSGCRVSADEAWRRTLAAADAAYDRTTGCSFTTFPAYEYTANTAFSTLHRNVIFRTERVPFPVTYFEQPTPQGLWDELARTCLDAGIGCDALAIPHNTNESNGNAFVVECPGAGGPEEERAQAARRAAMEPLMEVYQHKGDSECMNGLSGILGTPDELCDFEKLRRPPFEDCGDGTGSGGVSETGCVSRLDYLRGILLAGLGEEARIGVNPYRLGVIASTDTHNGTPGAVDEDRFVGHRGATDDTAAKRLQSGSRRAGPIFGPGGLAAIWAEENTRASLFGALRRREVYGTSGPRITLRFFGAWSFDAGACGLPSLIETAYTSGVPMGASLPPAAPGGAPSFVVAALRDPGTAPHPGTPLERLQIVKGWLENGERHVQVYDIAGDAIGQATVDPATCATSGPGADSLCAVWTDPDFDPAEAAFYYARVLENPTCRWTTWTCNALPPEDRPDGCSDPTIPATTQERAWSSPIWYSPPS